MAEKQEQQIVLAFFDSETAAKEAVNCLKEWDKASEDIKLGQIGILAKDANGKVKKELLGPREGKKGAGIGVILGAVAAALSGPIGWGALVLGGAAGGIIGHFIPAGLPKGSNKEGIKQLGEMLDAGKAVVAVFAAPAEADAVTKELASLGGKASAHAAPAEQVSAAAAVAAAPPPENQQLIAGVFATQAAYEAAAAKIKAMGPQLQMVNASDVLVLAKSDDGKVTVDVLDIGSSSGVNVVALADRITADVEAIAGNAPSSPTDLTTHAGHLGAALNPGAVAIGVFVDKQFAPKVEEGIGKMGAQLLSADDLKRIGAGLGAAVGMNDLAAKAASLTSAPAPAAPAVFDWHSEYAYSLALQAFVFGFPYVYNAFTRYKWTNMPQDPKHVPYSAVNKFWHATEVLDATYRDGGCPNNDTAYSVAWIDASKEPIIVTIPEIDPTRYWTMEMFSFTSDNFAYIGRRYNTKAGSYLVAGPNWQGKVPAGVTRVSPDSPTPWFCILGRTVVNGVEDLPNVHAIQAGYKLTPLSYWGKPESELPDRRDVYKPPLSLVGSDDPLGAWKAMNAMLAENPPPERQAVLLKQFADIGVGPGLDVEQQPEVVKQALQRAAAKGMLLLRQHFMSGVWVQRLVSGWRYPPANEGRFGDSDQFLLRAAEQSLVGVTANDPAEAVYLVNLTDDHNEPLTGEHKYELTFPKGLTPPVDAFWSLTVYGTDYNLVPNPINRYSIGDRTPGVQQGADGSTTFYFQKESPGPDKESNWLPTGDVAWFPILRLYIPHPEVVNATWECPPIKRVD